MQSTAKPGPRPGPPSGRGDAFERVAQAERLLDSLTDVGAERPLREHVEVFDAVHRALQDALEPAER